MEERQARHIGDLIRERNTSASHGVAAVPDRKYNVISSVRKILHLVLSRVLDVLATIGWFVTLPLIPRDNRVFTSRGQSRG